MRVAMSALALALCGCRGEPSFDERYSKSQNEIEGRAQDLDDSVNGSNAAGATDDGIESQID